MLRSRQTNKNIKDKLNREKYCNNEINYIVTKAINENEIIKNKIKEKYEWTTKKLAVHNRCIITGKPRRIIRKIKISTVTLKELVQDEKIENIKKK